MLARHALALLLMRLARASACCSRSGCCWPGRCRRSRDGGLGLAVRHAVRPRQLRAHQLVRARTSRPLLAHRAAQLLLRRRRHHRLGGVPFVAFTLYAGLTQVPDEVLEAASSTAPAGSSASAWSSSRYLKPIVLIVTVLQVIWDLRVFTQIYVLQDIGGIRGETNMLGVYIYQISIAGGDFGAGGAIAVIIVRSLLMPISIYYSARSRRRRTVSTVAAAGPVSAAASRPAPRVERRLVARWLAVSSSCCRVPRVLDGEDVVPAAQRHPQLVHPLLPDNFTLRELRERALRPGRRLLARAGQLPRRSPSLTVVVALFFAFLAAVAVSRFRFRGRAAFIIASWSCR